MKSILITGSNGFTGKNFLRFLEQEKVKAKVAGIDISESKDSYCRTYKCSLLDKKKIDNIIKKTAPDYIFHFAGVLRADNYKNLFDHNVIGTGNLLGAVVKNIKICNPKILISGSSAEYGMSSCEKKRSVTEFDPVTPITPYGVSKTAQGMVAMQYYYEYGLNIVRARTFNIIGPGQDNSLICSSLVRQIKSFGNRIDRKLVLGNLSAKRDFIDVRDVVRAYWMLLNYKKKIAGEIFNVGSGIGHSIDQIVKILIKQYGKKVTIKQSRDKFQKNDISIQVADISKIMRMIGWKPLISLKQSLNEMLLE